MVVIKKSQSSLNLKIYTILFCSAVDIDQFLMILLPNEII